MECSIVLHLSVLAIVVNCIGTALRLVAIKYKTPNYTHTLQQSTTYSLKCTLTILFYLLMEFGLHCLCLWEAGQGSVQDYHVYVQPNLKCPVVSKPLRNEHTSKNDKN